MKYRRAGVLGLLLMAGGWGISGCSNPLGESYPSARKVFHDPKVIALAEALERTNLEKANQLLREGADINASGDEGVTLPTWVMQIKNKKSFNWLMEHGANPNLIVTPDQGVLHRAAEADDIEWLEILLKYKADPNLKYMYAARFTQVPLFTAVTGRHRKNLELLIKAGADVNFITPQVEGGGTPVIDAALVGWFEGVYILLEAGADIRPRTLAGDDLTYLVVARQVDPGSDTAKWRDKVLRLLQERGADIKAAEKKAHEESLKDRRMKWN